MAKEISVQTRRAIVDHFSISGTEWAGCLSEDDFLARLYDLTSMPSQDYRFRNAAGDIHQHRVNWRDWDDNWVFYDSRFNILHASDHEFLRFLCETVHPVIRFETSDAYALVGVYNQHLQSDGWILVEEHQVSGKPVFAPQNIDEQIQVFEEPTGWQKVDRQLQEVRFQLDCAREVEQFQAVGLLCREVLISVAQEVFDLRRHRSEGEMKPSQTDAKRMLESYFDVELAGGLNEETRAHAKASLRLALALQHKRTAEFQMAALCGEATSSLVNILAILEGRRSRLG